VVPEAQPAPPFAPPPSRTVLCSSRFSGSGASNVTMRTPAQAGLAKARTATVTALRQENKMRGDIKRRASFKEATSGKPALERNASQRARTQAAPTLT
jgi:hypothetical protein